MTQLGLTLYPSNIKNDKEYLSLGIKYGFTLVYIYTKEILKHMNIIQYAKEIGYKIMTDLHQESYQELLNIGIDLIKTNKFDINIPINNKVIQVDMNQKYNHAKYVCYEYYPLKYTGLEIYQFKQINETYQKHYLKTIAFVSNENKCTLEKHRDLPIDIQIKHLIQLGIDTILIGNKTINEKDLINIQTAINQKNTLHIHLLENSVIEDKIINEFHLIKQKNEYIIRSSNNKYQNYSIFPKENQRLYKGDVVIINDTIKDYRGELHILLKDLKNDGRYNLVGKIEKNEFILLEENIQELKLIKNT